MLRIQSLPLFAWVLVLSGVFAGCATLHLEEGQAAYDELRYQDAIHHFGKAVQRDPEAEAYRKLAKAHALVNENEEAAAAYSVLVSLPDATDDDRIGYASVLFKSGEYAQAERLLNAVSQRDPGNDVAAALRRSTSRSPSCAVPSGRNTWYWTRPWPGARPYANFQLGT